MNIYCEWQGDRLIIKSCGNVLGYVEQVEGEACLTMTNRSCNPSLTFGEIEHIMDNWENMPKP